MVHDIKKWMRDPNITLENDTKYFFLKRSYGIQVLALGDLKFKAVSRTSYFCFSVLKHFVLK